MNASHWLSLSTLNASQPMSDQIRKLISATKIEQRVQELGDQLDRELPPGPLTVVGVLTGCLLFLSDLVRSIRRPMQIGLVQASSYQGGATEPGELTLSTQLLPRIEGRNVLLVDDIFDTGRTLEGLIRELKSQQPASLMTAVLLTKPDRHQVSLRPDYIGFEVPDVFVVGYGLDWNGEFRHLPYIGVRDIPQPSH